MEHLVVNCFQNCIFTYDSQQCKALPIPLDSCELLSKLYFYLWFPTYIILWSKCIKLWIAFKIVFLLMIPNQLSFSIVIRRLWIAFKIVFLLMIPNKSCNLYSNASVVNCFQNCIFTYDSQLGLLQGFFLKSCELLSKLYFYLWFPTVHQ